MESKGAGYTWVTGDFWPRKWSSNLRSLGGQWRLTTTSLGGGTTLTAKESRKLVGASGIQKKGGGQDIADGWNPANQLIGGLSHYLQVARNIFTSTLPNTSWMRRCNDNVSDKSTYSWGVHSSTPEQPVYFPEATKVSDKLPSQKERLPTIHFQGRAVSLMECNAWGLSIFEFHQPSATSQSASVRSTTASGFVLASISKKTANLQTTFDAPKLGRYFYIFPCRNQRLFLPKNNEKNWKLLNLESCEGRKFKGLTGPFPRQAATR